MAWALAGMAAPPAGGAAGGTSGRLELNIANDVGDGMPRMTCRRLQPCVAGCVFVPPPSSRGTRGTRYRSHPSCLFQWPPFSSSTPTTGLRERGNDTSKSTGRNGRQKAATRRNIRREERVTVQGPVKEQQPDGMSHRGGGGGGGLFLLYPRAVDTRRTRGTL